MEVIKQEDRAINFNNFITFNVEGRWDSDAFEKLFWTIKVLRDYVELEELIYAIEDDLIGDKLEMYQFWFGKVENLFIRFNNGQSSPITIKTIQYSSPGWVDFFLSAGVVGSVIVLITKYFPNSKERAETDLIRTEILEKKVRILKELGIEENKISGLLNLKEKQLGEAIDNLKFFQKQGKVVSIQDSDSNGVNL